MRTEWQCTTRLFKDQWIKCLDGTCNMQISDGTIPGLYLRYYAKSKKISFYLGYRNVITRQHKNMLIGRYSDFKLAEVKQRAKEQKLRTEAGLVTAINNNNEEEKDEE